MTDLSTPETEQSLSDLVASGELYDVHRKAIDASLEAASSKSPVEKFPDNLYDLITLKTVYAHEMPENIRGNYLKPIELAEGYKDFSRNHPVLSLMGREEEAQEDESRHILASEKIAKRYLYPLDQPITSKNSLENRQEVGEYFIGRIRELAVEKNDPVFVQKLDGFMESMKDVTVKYQAFGNAVKPLLPVKK
ncbi:MAG: hypothetical protein JWM96_859 [Alphaproteobacteria bacterium]|nr:hypothetical protein [Alphaproteobacteria bacterium]